MPCIGNPKHTAAVNEVAPAVGQVMGEQPELGPVQGGGQSHEVWLCGQVEKLGVSKIETMLRTAGFSGVVDSFRAWHERHKAWDAERTATA